MPKFNVRFELDEKPGEMVAEYIIDTQWEADAIAQATARWATEHPEDARKPHTVGCGYV